MSKRWLPRIVAQRNLKKKPAVQALGIDITEHGVTFAQLTKQGTAWHLTHASEQGVSSLLFRKGRLTDVAGLRQLVGDQLVKAQLQADHVVIASNEGPWMIHVVSSPVALQEEVLLQQVEERVSYYPSFFECPAFYTWYPQRWGSQEREGCGGTVLAMAASEHEALLRVAGAVQQSTRQVEWPIIAALRLLNLSCSATPTWRVNVVVESGSLTLVVLHDTVICATHTIRGSLVHILEDSLLLKATLTRCVRFLEHVAREYPHFSAPPQGLYWSRLLGVAGFFESLTDCVGITMASYDGTERGGATHDVVIPQHITTDMHRYGMAIGLAMQGLTPLYPPACLRRGVAI